MNNLSWLIYWADTLPHVSTWLCVVSFLLFCLGAAAIGAGYGIISDSSNINRRFDYNQDSWTTSEKTDTDQYKLGVSIRRVGFVLTPLFFVLWGASFLVPSKDTFYLIAASEAGEQAIQTPEFTKVRRVLNNWLDDQLKDEPKKSSNAS